jgi:hypothetical protein
VTESSLRRDCNSNTDTPSSVKNKTTVATIMQRVVLPFILDSRLSQRCAMRIIVSVVVIALIHHCLRTASHDNARPQPIVSSTISITTDVSALGSGIPGHNQAAGLLSQSLTHHGSICKYSGLVLLSTATLPPQCVHHVPWFPDGATAVRFLSVTTLRSYALRQVVNLTLEPRFL